MTYFSKATSVFLQRLARNNDREWFQANKAEYENAVSQPAQAFAMTMAAALEAETGRCHIPKIFRIFRDVRFSKDKRPYNSHVRISFRSETGPTAPGYFFSLERDHLMLGAGVFEYEKAALDHFRRRIDGREGAGLQSIITGFAGKDIRLSDPELKRVAAPYPLDHPRADLLRRKGLTAWIDSLEPSLAYGPDAIEACILQFRKLKPLYDWMSNT